MKFEEQLKNKYKNDLEIREAFIIEELKPFFLKDGDDLIMTSQLRMRLNEISDYKKKVKEAIENMYFIYEEYDLDKERTKKLLLAELGLCELL